MAQHGYLREYDEGWDRGDERDRWRSDEDRNEPGRNFMFDDRERGRDRDREQGWGGSGGGHGRDSDRGFIDRMGDRARAWMGDQDQDQRHRHDNERERSRHSGGQSDWGSAPRNFSSHQDDHYRSWRDRQMQALDRDYEDYCREREQQFHQDFGSWRQNRQKQQPTGQSGQQQNQQQQGQEPVMELTDTTSSAEPMGSNSPMADATLGTNNSENNTTGGRGRR